MILNDETASGKRDGDGLESIKRGAGPSEDGFRGESLIMVPR